MAFHIAIQPQPIFFFLGFKGGAAMARIAVRVSVALLGLEI